MNILTKGALVALLLSGAAAPAFAQASASASGDGSVTIFRPITVTKNSDLKFGTVVRPTSGAGTVTIDNTGARSFTGAVALLPSTTGNAQFTVAGEGGQAFTLTVPPSFSIANQSGPGSLTVTTSQDVANGAQNLDSTLGNGGVKVVKVGGEITVADTTDSGFYTGSFNVTAAYN